MRQIREIIRQKWALGLSHRAVARSLRVGLGTISSVTSRAHAAGLDWAQVQTLADEALESRLYGRPDIAGQRQRPVPDCAWIHAERRRPGVTLELRSPAAPRTLSATTARRWPSPTSSACTRWSPIATSASASSTGARPSASRPKSTSPPRRRCTARWTALLARAGGSGEEGVGMRWRHASGAGRPRPRKRSRRGSLTACDTVTSPLQLASLPPEPFRSRQSERWLALRARSRTSSMETRAPAREEARLVDRSTREQARTAFVLCILSRLRSDAPAQPVARRVQ